MTASMLLGALVASLVAAPLQEGLSQTPTGSEIVERAERLLWGRTMQARMEMAVTTPRFQRTLTMQVWVERPRRSFVRVLAPAREAGIGSLRIDDEMWNYLPAIERTIRIPPSMMLQPWMGSDFTNDDLVKESSIVTDYDHRVLGVQDSGGVPAWIVEAAPKPGAPVVWGRIVLRIRQADFIPVAQEYYDERGRLIRVLQFSDVRSLGGRVIPTRWEMHPTDTPDNSTTIVLQSATWDARIDATIFTQRNLQRP